MKVGRLMLDIFEILTIRPREVDDLADALVERGRFLSTVELRLTTKRLVADELLVIDGRRLMITEKGAKALEIARRNRSGKKA